MENNENISEEASSWEPITRKSYYVGVKKPAKGVVVEETSPEAVEMRAELAAALAERGEERKRIKLPYGKNVDQQVGQTVVMDTREYPQMKPSEWRRAILAYRRSVKERYYPVQDGTILKITRLPNE